MRDKTMMALEFSGAKLRAHRIEAGLTLDDLAARSDIIDSKIIIRYEHDKVQPKINRVLALCAGLGCKVEDLCE